MCYSSAKGTTKEGQKAISRGVLVLLLPPLAFMTLGAGMAVRYSKKRRAVVNKASSIPVLVSNPRCIEFLLVPCAVHP